MAFAAPSTRQNGVDPRMFPSADATAFGYLAIPNLLIEHVMRTRIARWIQ